MEKHCTGKMAEKTNMSCFPKNPDARALLERYSGQQSAFHDDTVFPIMPPIVEAFSSGSLKGDTIIGMCVGPFIHFLLPACEHFTDIVFAGPTDQCIQEVKKWQNNEPGAIDYSHIAELVCKLQGRGENWTELQSMLQRKLKQVLQYDAANTNPLSPIILPQADCLLLTHYLECHVQNKESFCIGLKNASSLLKTGGHLIMIGCTEATFYMAGKYKHPHLFINEDFIRKAFTGAGYCIEELHKVPRKNYDLLDVADFTGFIFVNARKEVNV